MAARPTSNRMKVIRGTDKPSRERDEPDFAVVGDYPDPPGWLVNLDALEEWEHKVRALTDAGVLTEVSLSTLAKYCHLHGEYIDRARRGVPSTASDVTQIRLMATEFGFTPASSLKVGGTKKPEGNKFSDLKSG